MSIPGPDGPRAIFRAPMPFAELIAQDRALGSLRAALRRGALHHAYLFGGPAGVGKGTAARLLAQAANCEAPGEGGALRDDPCGACAACRKIARDAHPDVRVLAEEREMARAGRWEPRGGRAPSREIVVDQIRDLVDRRLSLRRFEGRRRVVVIDPADAMNAPAQNALLKTLEEPPDDTTLVLVSSSPDSLLPTIRSRCLRLAFGPVPEAAVAARLVSAGRPPERAALAAALSGGSIGRALAMDDEALVARRDAVARLAGIDGDRTLDWLAFAREQGEDREEAEAIGELLLVFWRDVLALQAGGAALALAGLSDAARRAASGLPPLEVLRRRALTAGMLAALRRNGAATLALERMLVGWFHGR